MDEQNRAVVFDPSRKRPSVVAFESLKDLESKITSFIDESNEVEHSFRWASQSFDKILAARHDEMLHSA